MNLEMMGYSDLAKSGYAGHRIHIGAPVPEINPTSNAAADRATLEALMSTSFWNDKENHDRWNRKWNTTDNRNGYWIAAGHLFKVLYSYHRLIRILYFSANISHHTAKVSSELASLPPGSLELTGPGITAGCWFARRLFFS